MTTSWRFTAADIDSLTVLEAGTPIPGGGKAGLTAKGRLPGRKPPASPSVLALGRLTPASISVAPSPRGCVLWEHLHGHCVPLGLSFPSLVLFQGSLGRGLCPPPWSPSSHCTAPSFPGGLAAGGGSSVFQGEDGSNGRGPPSPCLASVPASGPGVWWGPLETAPPLCLVERQRWVCWQWAQGLVPTSPAGCWRLQVRALYYMVG